jgi:hypothetical protein
MNPRRRAGFMGDMDFPFDRPPAPRRRRRQALTPAQDDHDEDYIEALAYHNEAGKDDMCAFSRNGSWPWRRAGSLSTRTT